MDSSSAPPTLLGDRDLLAGVAAHRPEALLELYDRHSRAAYTLALRMLADGARAEECIHAVFLEIWRHPPPWEPIGIEFSSWLLAAVYRNALAQQRAARPAPPGPLDATPLAQALASEIGADYQSSVPPPGAAPDPPPPARLDAPPAAPGAAPPSDEDSAQRRLDQRQDELLVLVAHELRTPITVIKASIQLAARRLEAGGQRAAAAQLATLDGQVERLIALVDYLLRAGQLNGGTPDLRLTSFDLAALVREVGTTMQDLSAIHTLTIQAPERLTMEGDADRLAQVLRNLIANAIKYSPAGGLVEITLGCAGQKATLCVRDQGIGIPVADRDLVFERFGRAGNVRAIPGFGLGLSMSREIVQAHQGRLWVAGPAAGAPASTLAGPLPDQDTPGCLLCLVLPLRQEHRP